MSTAGRIPMRATSPASSPTATRATFVAARTSPSCWATRDRVSAGLTAGATRILLFAHVLVGEPASTSDQVAGRLSPEHALVPGVGDLVEQLVAEFLRRAGDRSAAERPVEVDGRLVVGQRPHHEALHAALHEIAPCRREQPPAEAESLEFGAQIKLVDLAVVLQAARPVAPIVGIARDGVAERQERDAAALADRAVPPVGAAPRDQSLEFPARNDSLIGGPPSVVMRIGDRFGIACARTTDLDEDRAHESNRTSPRLPHQEGCCFVALVWMNRDDMARIHCGA